MKYIRIGKQVCSLFGRSEHCFEQLHHESTSRQHAVFIQTTHQGVDAQAVLKRREEEMKRAEQEEVRYVMRPEIHELVLVDLYSTHGTFLNGERLTPGVPYRIYDYDVIRFGASSRHYKVKGLNERRPANAPVSAVTATAEQASAGVSESSKRKQPEGANEASSRPEKKSKSSDGPEQIRVRHILIKHRNSRRPSSWKQEVITRTEEEALALAHEFRARIARGEVKFEDLARTESDCGSYKYGGDLGRFGRGKMQPAFEAAAFALQVGELSQPVKSDSGIHLILRLE